MAQIENDKIGKGRKSYRLELVGFKTGNKRPDIFVQAVDRKYKVLYSDKVKEDGAFKMTAEVLKKAHQIIIGARDDKGDDTGFGYQKHRTY